MLIIEGHEVRKVQLNKNKDRFTDDELYEFCILNEDLRIERDANQNIIIMAPVSGNSGFYEDEVITDIGIWRRKNGGVSFSSATGFILPNGAMRSPDGCWISPQRWSKITDEQKEKFLPIVPDFIVEVRSKTDSLKSLKAKMQEWIENGVRLGWLIDIKGKQAFIYRQNGSIEIVEGLNQKLTGEDVMPSFEFDLTLMKVP